MMQTGWHCINKLQIFVAISRYVHIAETCFSKCLRRRNNYWTECIGMYISESNLWQNKNYILFDREEREEGTFLAGRQGIASWNSGLLIRSCVIVNLARNVVLVRVWMMSMRWSKGSRKVKHASFFISLLCDCRNESNQEHFFSNTVAFEIWRTETSSYTQGNNTSWYWSSEITCKFIEENTVDGVN